MQQKVLVCGGRDYRNSAQLFRILDVAHYANPIVLLIAGGAKGADTLAVAWADSRLVARRVFNADWNADGRAAGSIRNQKMLDEGKPDLVIAFPGGRGTADMIARAERANVFVVRIRPHGESTAQAAHGNLGEGSTGDAAKSSQSETGR